VALYGSPSPSYVLCGAGVTKRSACTAGANVSGAAAIASIRNAAHQPGVQRIVVFIPGFRTNMLEGRSSAEFFQETLGPRFLVVQIDWGSSGTAAGYKADGAQARRQTPALSAFVVALHDAVPDREIDVFAHSMGTRLAAGAMAALKPTTAPDDPNRNIVVAETVFAAPDLSLQDYQRAITREPDPFGRVTIYVSKHDKALLLSSIIHLHRRIGQLAIWHKAVANTSVVDASAADPAANGHGYALHDAPVIRDIGAVFMEMPIPHPAWIRKSPATVMWTLVPARVPEKIASADSGS